MQAQRFPLFFLCVFAMSCSSGLPIENRPCPCAVGWVCCESGNVCAKNNLSCPTVQGRAVPDKASLWFGETLTISSTSPVSWSLDEGPQGGAIDAMGNYQAPLRMGTFHVRGRSYVANEPDVVVPITVGPTELSLFAGQLGGEGTADDIGKDARFSSVIRGMTGDGQSLYVTAPYREGSVRKIDIASGRVSTLAQNLYFPNAPTLVGSRLFVMEGSSRGAGERLIEVAQDGSVLPIAGSTNKTRPPISQDGVGEQANFGFAVSMAAFGDNELFVLEKQLLRRVDLKTASVQTVPQSETWENVRNSPIGADWQQILKQGDSYYLVDTAGQVWELDPHQFTLTPKTTLPRSGYVSNPVKLNGNSLMIWAGRLGQIDLVSVDYNSVTNVIGPNAIGNLDYTAGVAKVQIPIAFWATATELYFFDEGNASVRFISTSNNYSRSNWTLKTLAGQASHEGYGANLLTGPQGLAASTDNSILVVQRSPGNEPATRVSRISGSGLVELIPAETPSIISAVLETDEGLIYLTTHSVYLISKTGVSGSFVGTHDRYACDDSDGYGSQGRVCYPQGFCAFGRNQVLVADTFNNKIKIVDLAKARADTFLSHFKSPWAVAHDGGAHVFVADDGGLTQYDLTQKVRTQLVTIDPKVSKITSLAWDPAGLLYLVDQKQAEVRAYVPSTGELFTIAGHKEEGRGAKIGLLPARLNVPTSVAYKPDHSIVISDTQENAILQAH